MHSYLMSMQDILIIYCNLELDVIHRSSNKKSIMQSSYHLCYVLRTYCLDKEKYISHTLLKLKSDYKEESWKKVMHLVYM